MTAADILARTLPSLGLIVGALLLLRHWAQRGRSVADASVRVLTRTGIAKGAVVAVVAVGERRLLIGASEQGVNLLTELDADATTSATDAVGDAAVTDAITTDPVLATDLPRGLRPRALAGALAGTFSGAFPSVSPSAPPQTLDRPRMAPIDRLRHLTVRRAVPSHPRRPTGVQRRT